MIALMAGGANASDALQWNGFLLIRPQTAAGIPFDDDRLSAQLQAGIDWRPTPGFGAHVHLLARNEGDGSHRGRAGIVEAFAEKNVIRDEHRVRVMAGAFFLPTSRENIDSLWETPYTISSSALNTWMGEELRPVGVDVTWTRRTRTFGAFTGGGTVFRGNDTFGALPVDRGWAIGDRWTLLGEHVPTTRTDIYTSVSAETDDRLGWSGRVKWNDDRGAFQFTRIDNRSDALRYGDLFNWATRFNIAGGDYSWGDWTVASEFGWGSTAIQGRRRFSSEIRATYLLLSRRFSNVRATLRADEYRAGSDRGRGLTAALFWDAHPRLRTGVEAITAQGERRLSVEARVRF